MAKRKLATLSETIRSNIKKMRAKKFPEYGSQVKCATAFGISPQMWSNWETGRNTPDDAYQARLAAFFGVSVAELRGETDPIRDTSAAAPRKANYSIPVIGLASCGISGWFNPNPLAIRASLALEYQNHENLFAVVAVGKSMIPNGILEGYLLFCDPLVAPNPDDAVYIKLADGTATVKQFVGIENEMLILRGWSDPDRNGNQKPYIDQRALHTVESIACVVIVQRRA